MNCRLCLTDLNEEIAIPLFDNNGVNIQAELVKTIEAFLSLELTSIDAVICEACWKHLEDFYIFLKIVEKKQIEFNQQRNYELSKAKNQNAIFIENVDEILTIDLVANSIDEGSDTDFNIKQKPLKRKIDIETSNNIKYDCKTIDDNFQRKRQKRRSTQDVPENNFELPESYQNVISNKSMTDKKATEVFSEDTNSSNNVIVQSQNVDHLIFADTNSPEVIGKYNSLLKKSVLIVGAGNNETLINLESDDSLNNIVSSNNDSEQDDDKILICSEDEIRVLVKSNKKRNHHKKYINELKAPSESKAIVKELDENIKINILENADGSNYACGICKACSENFEELSIHFKTNHVGLTAFVDCCGRRFSSMQSLQSHWNHSNNKNPECNKVCASKKDHQTEISYQSGSKNPNGCEICSKNFYNAESFSKHLRYHTEGSNSNLNCDICKLIFETSEELQSHVTAAHMNAIPYRCDYCGERFERHFKRQFVEHLQNHKLDCSFCNRKFKNKYFYDRHMDQHKKTTPAYCHICKCKCPSEEALEKHNRINHQSFEIDCKHCKQKLSTFDQLKDHLVMHSEPQMYFCPHCPKMTNTSNKISKHIKEAHPQEWIDNELKKMCGIDETSSK